jgi:hypothetical protein
MKRLFCILWFALFLFSDLLAQQMNAYRPELFFREDWKETPPEIPLTQKHVSNPDLLVNTYGPGKEGLKKSNHEKPVDDPYYIWSGMCSGNWMVSLKHRTNNVDLSGFAKIVWRSKQAGFRQLHITLKLADGSWLISDLSDGPSKDWRITEFNIQDITWHKLEIERIVEIGLAKDPDLSNVVEIGFTDLMPGGLVPGPRSAACSRLDWIEVYGKEVK